MQITYSGPQPTRTVELGRGEAITVEKGKPFTVDPEIGKKLIRQRHFDKKTTRKKTTRKKPPAPPAADAANPGAGEAASAATKGD